MKNFPKSDVDQQYYCLDQNPIKINNKLTFSVATLSYERLLYFLGKT